MTLERILVGLDGSRGSADALQWAIGLASVTGAEILAVHAFELPIPAIPPAPGVAIGVAVDEIAMEQSIRNAVERAFAVEWSGPLDGAGVRHRRLFEEGRPVDVLLDVAERERADLLVTGRHGRGPLASLAGSVSRQLVHRSRMPVTIVPTGGDRDEGASRQRE